MGNNKGESKTKGARRALVYFISFTVLITTVSSLITAGVLSHVAPKRSLTSMALAEAERGGAFRAIREDLDNPSIEVGILGEAVLVEGSVEDDAAIQKTVLVVKSRLGASSYTVLHPHYERSISGPVEWQAVREGMFDYKGRSILIINLLRARFIRPVQHVEMKMAGELFASTTRALRRTPLPPMPPRPPIPPRD